MGQILALFVPLLLPQQPVPAAAPAVPPAVSVPAPATGSPPGAPVPAAAGAIPRRPLAASPARAPAVPAAFVSDPGAVIPAALDSGLVLLADGAAPGRSFRLGDGGIGAIDPDGAALPGERGECTTPGGVHVQCRKEGVKLTFASGRELLWAPDGFLHLRDGTVAGPFESGVELRLLDGCSVRIDRGASRRTPITEVVVATEAGVAVRLWRRAEAVREPGGTAWSGERLFCLGDGGALYRALALGPVITLERVLVPTGALGVPLRRVALDTGAIARSLQLLRESRARIADPTAVAEIGLVLDNHAAVWPAAGAPPARIGSSPLLYLLPAGYELRFQVQGGDVRLQMARHQQRPFVEWQLGYGAAVRCVEAAMQPTGNFVAMPPMAPGLRPRLERHELGQAIAVLSALQR